MSDLAPEARAWDFLRGAMATKAFGIVADLGVADALERGPRPVAELARESGADADTLYRILRALASDGVFAEDEPRVFRNTEVSDLLRRDRANGWAEFAHLFGSVFYDAVATADPRAREPTFARRFGTDFWSWLAANPPERAVFDAAMGSEKRVGRLAELEWDGDETVVDVGGGNGSLLRELLQQRPGLRGIVFDLPETVRDEALFDERIEFVAGSFFESVPRGDVYVLSGILHDWNDERASAILRTIRTAAAAGTLLLVVESVVPPGNEPNGAKWLDLLMLVLGGRERTEPEWRALLDGAGFRVERLDDGLIEATCR